MTARLDPVQGGEGHKYCKDHPVDTQHQRVNEGTAMSLTQSAVCLLSIRM